MLDTSGLNYNCKISQTCVKRSLLNRQKKKKIFKANYRSMQVKSIAECSKGTFIKLPFVIKIFVFFLFLSGRFNTGFTVLLEDRMDKDMVLFV